VFEYNHLNNKNVVLRHWRFWA